MMHRQNICLYVRNSYKNILVLQNTVTKVQLSCIFRMIQAEKRVKEIHNLYTLFLEKE